jgi:hypothetical protein
MELIDCISGEQTRFDGAVPDWLGCAAGKSDNGWRRELRSCRGRAAETAAASY